MSGISRIVYRMVCRSPEEWAPMENQEAALEKYAELIAVLDAADYTNKANQVVIEGFGIRSDFGPGTEYGSRKQPRRLYYPDAERLS